MIILKLKAAKRFFFDRQKVIDQLGKDRARFLRNAGRYVQKTARNLMPRKGKSRKPPKNLRGKAYLKWIEEIKNQPASQPGKPPHVHSDDPNRTLKNILFIFNGNNSVIVGPVGLERSRASVPSLHEHGGTQLIREKRVGKVWAPMNGRRRPGQPVRSRMAKYPARPFMKPAVEKTKGTGKFKNLWFGGSS